MDKIVKEIIVYETREFDKFKTMEGQPTARAKKNSPDLAAKMRKANNTQYQPIIVNENYEIIDGNTRRYACELLGIPVRYSIVETTDTESLEMMKAVNGAQKPWTEDNFIEFYATGFKKQEYIDLIEFKSEYNLTNGLLRVMNKKFLSRSVSDGDILGAIDYANTKVQFSLVTEIEKLTKGTLPSTQEITEAVVAFYRYGKFNPDDLLCSIEKHWDKVVKDMAFEGKIKGRESVKQALQKAYNHKKPEDKRKRIFKENL